MAAFSVLHISGWLALLARSDRAQDAEILTLRHQIVATQRQFKTFPSPSPGPIRARPGNR
jgi:hypothetical protein